MHSTITTYRNAVLIFNPFSGGLNGRRRGRLDRALRILRENGHEVRVVPTEGPGTAGGIARREIEAGADLILVAGGDGTVNEALNGMTPSTVPLGLLPAGTGNVLAHELKVSLRIEDAARALGSWAPRRISTGLLRTTSSVVPRHFLLMAGIGFDARVVNAVDPDLKRRHGKLSYWVAGFEQAGRRLEEFEVGAGENSYSCSFALASRVRNYGGTMEIARHASLASDDFAVVLMRGTNSIRYLKYLTGAFTGRLARTEGITLLRARILEFRVSTGQRVYIQVDGEAAGRLPASVEIVPDALTLLVPPEFTG